jgi:poly(3-hydroxybutyrate) depolymerase
VRVFVLLVAGLFVVLIVFLASLQWSGPHASAIATDVLRLQILAGPLPVIIDTLAVAGLLFLLFRRPTRRRVLVAALAVIAGAAVALLILWWVGVSNTFGVYIGKTISLWVIAAFAVIGLAVATFWSSGWLRKLGAAVSILAVALSATLGINAYFDLDPTIGDLAGISTQPIIRLPSTTSTAGSTPAPGSTLPADGALWANWNPPADMPKIGKMGSVTIPNTLSGFHARPAGLYLPPAALVPNPPALPLVIMMMGQPGNTDPAFIGGILNVFASRHEGLAPIVVVADQLGNPAIDTLCLNTSRYGNVETYITRDVVNWARSHLHILQDPAHWTIAGYSNGGECAIYFGAKYPNIWGNVIDISGEAYAGSEQPNEVAADVFHGDWAAYEKTWPVSILGSRSYRDSEGIFTVASDDLSYRLQAATVARAARAARWKSTYFEVPNAGHGAAAVDGGLVEGFNLLFPRWGLSAPKAGHGS